MAKKTYNIFITPPGIRKTLRRFKPCSAIAEYVWNGFDAGASRIDIRLLPNLLGAIDAVSVRDNGSGIDYYHLEDKFRPFLDTNKDADPTSHRYGLSFTHGKNGYGRLTFFCFADKAIWATKFESESGNQEYDISVLASSLDKYAPGPLVPTSVDTGTEVTFEGCRGLYTDVFPAELKRHLALEFAWLLEMPSPTTRQIYVDGKKLDYQWLIDSKDQNKHSIGPCAFDIRYVQWSEKLHDEYSRHYFLTPGNIEVGNRCTTLNQKGDGFYHSVYILSELFDSVVPASIADDDDSGQQQLRFGADPEREVFRELQEHLHSFLSARRKPFLRRKARSYTETLETRGVLPALTQSPWDIVRIETLRGVVEELYVSEPLIFSGLSDKQTRTVVGLLHLIIQSEERDSLLEILDQVIQLETVQREEFARLLRKTELSCVITTISMIEGRFMALNELKRMIAEPHYAADELTHLQSFIENHYWMFGEQYHLVAAAEDDFESALRKYLYILRGEKSTVKVDHPDKRKQMDVFAVRWRHNAETIDNIVLELKHPSITLGSKELLQVKNYMKTVLSIPHFNGTDMFWEFYLIGTEYNDDIEQEIVSHEAYGERHLAHIVDRYKVYVLKWSDVWTSIELRHKFLLDRLQIRRDHLLTDKRSADDIISSLSDSAARQ